MPRPRSVLSWLMRPSAALDAALAERALSSGLSAALADATKPVIAIHVRQGDACGYDGVRTGRTVCSARVQTAVHLLAVPNPTFNAR